MTSFAEPLETAVALLGTSQQRQVTSEALSATQALQKKALDLCAHRMECARPLIQAFSERTRQAAIMIPSDVASRLQLTADAAVSRAPTVQQVTNALADLIPGQRVFAEIQALLPTGAYRP